MSPVDWYSPTWGNRIHIGTTAPDAHTTSEEAAEADR